MDDDNKLREAFTVKPDGFMFSLERSTLTLLSLLVADKEIQSYYYKYHLPHMEYMHGEVKESMIVELLIEIATRYRIMSWGTKENRSKEFKDENVGTLFVGNKDKIEDLSMHEACNKIIHAKEIEFDVSPLTNSKEHFYFKPFIHVYGEKGKNNWATMIDVVLFCNAANQSLEKAF